MHRLLSGSLLLAAVTLASATTQAQCPGRGPVTASPPVLKVPGTYTFSSNLPADFQYVGTTTWFFGTTAPVPPGTGFPFIGCGAICYVSCVPLVQTIQAGDPFVLTFTLPSLVGQVMCIQAAKLRVSGCLDFSAPAGFTFVGC